MPSKSDIVRWARAQAELLREGLVYTPADGPYGGYWQAAEPRTKTKIMARAAAGLDFLGTYAGQESSWFQRAQIAYESNGDRASMETGVHAISETINLWADQIEEGILALPLTMTEGVRSVAATDVMEQVRALFADPVTHVAAPIMLAGAALEMALRSAVEQRGLDVPERPGIAAYGRALVKARVIGKQHMKDLDQMGGLRNQAAHGEFDELSRERAGLMEQQVNLFLMTLQKVMVDSGDHDDKP